MSRYFLAVGWAAATVVLALVMRAGWIDREPAMTLLLVMPGLAFVTLQRGRCFHIVGEV